jgi:hypothetical protein
MYDNLSVMYISLHYMLCIWYDNLSVMYISLHYMLCIRYDNLSVMYISLHYTAAKMLCFALNACFSYILLS